MLLRESDFISTEGGAPLLMQNHQYLPTNADTAWNKTRVWTKLLLNMESTSSSLDDEKKQHSITIYDANDKQSQNYGLKIIPNPDRLVRKDADRTFITEKRRQLLITMLESLKTALGDYQQTMSYICGVLLLFFPPKTVLQMMFRLARNPQYNMAGYWRSEAVSQGIDAYILFEIIKKVNTPLYKHLNHKKIVPETFIQKWFGGLAAQVMPIEQLIEFWTQFFRHDFRYLFKFMIVLLQTLTPLLLSIKHDYQLYEVLRVERQSKFKFWRSIGIQDNHPQIKTDGEKISLFFKKVLSDTNSIGNLYNLDKIDFQKERVHAFNKYLSKRLLQTATIVTFKQAAQENEDDDGFGPKDCSKCDDGFADLFCTICEVYLCEDCHLKGIGQHQVGHECQELDTQDLD
eukprot:80596_1